MYAKTGRAYGPRAREQASKELQEFFTKRNRFKVLRNVVTFLLAFALIFLSFALLFQVAAYANPVFINEIYTKVWWYWIWILAGYVFTLIAVSLNHFVFPTYVTVARDADRSRFAVAFKGDLPALGGARNVAHAEMNALQIECEQAKAQAISWGWGTFACLFIASLLALVFFGNAMLHIVSGNAWSNAIDDSFCAQQINATHPYVLDTANKGFNVDCYTPFEFSLHFNAVFAAAFAFAFTASSAVIVAYLIVSLNEACKTISLRITDAQLEQDMRRFG
jgi:hypothetical protein